jgi:hypothetical protein
MVQFMATAGFPADIRFFFNLTGPVGRGYPNARADDVSFVQLCFAAGAQGAAESGEIKRVLESVRVTGRMDGETQAAIDVWQLTTRGCSAGGTTPMGSSAWRRLPRPTREARLTRYWCSIGS